jgi:hypothetical protein
MGDPICAGCKVVVVDAKGHVLRARGRALRGTVVSIDCWAIAIVAMARTGEQTPWSLRYLRRCPELAYCRPALPGAA